MNPLKQLLLLILCAGVTGSAQAIEQSRNLGTLRPAPTAMDTRQPQFADAGPFAGARTMSALPDKIDGSRGERKVAFSASDLSTENAGAGLRERSRLAEATVPEPSEWMQLVCGLAFVAFVARRRTHLPAG